MREELQLQIAEKFDFMKRKPLKNPKIVDDLYGAFGIDTGDGWYQLIYDLCEEIAETFNKAGKPVNIVMDQVKEKWGTLRFYYHFEGEKHRLHAFDSIGGGGVRLTPKGDELHSQVSNIVRKYEEKSGTVCERCGSTGTVRTDLGWVRCLCDDCYSKTIENIKKNRT